MLRQAVIALAKVLLVLLISHAAVHGQNSHRILAPPDGIDRNALSQGDQIRELLKKVEASEALKRGSLEDIDPELLRAVQQWAKQIEGGGQASPELTGFLDSIRDRLSTLPADPSTGELPFPGGESVAPRPGSISNPQQRKTDAALQRNPSGERKTGGKTDPGSSGQKTLPGQLRKGRAGSHNPEVTDQIGEPALQGDRGSSQLQRDKLDALRDSGLTIQQQFSRVMEQARRDAILDGVPSSTGDGVAKWIEDALSEAQRIKSSPARKKRTSKSNRPPKKTGNTPKKTTKPSSGAKTNTKQSPTGSSHKRSSSSKKVDGNESTITGSLTKQIRQMASRAEKTFEQVTKTESRANIEAQQETNSESAGEGESSASSIQRFLTLAALLGVIAIAYWLWQRQSVRRAAVTLAQMARSLPADLRTREDVLETFHVLTARTIEVQNRWWTHHRAATELMAVTPHGRKAIEALTVVYEQARYLPPEIPLSSGHLKEARQVLTMCSG